MIEESSTSCKVHYVGFDSSYDEWKEKSGIVDLTEDSGEHLHSHIIECFSLYEELGVKIKASLNSGRKESPIVCIDMPFDKIEFDGGLKLHGTEKQCIRIT